MIMLWIRMNSQAQVLLSSNDLTADMDFLIGLRFKLINIYPDDEPEVAIMKGHGLQIRLDINASDNKASIHILTDDISQFDDEKTQFIAPNGSVYHILEKSYQLIYPQTKHQLEVIKYDKNEPWSIGRAGMLYRDLLPSRLGGSIMVSHIHIPNGGPVPDMVHYHTIGFQLIFCYSGWVKLVYEDQGPAFILRAGDCVTQPPEIRHRVLEASDNLEVIEIGVPAQHMTSVDHEMQLPTKNYRPQREFQGQRFCHHQLKQAIWQPWHIEGFEYRESGVAEASKELASVKVARIKNSATKPQTLSHNKDILFVFIMQGQIKLAADGQQSKFLSKGDSYVIPPHMQYQISHFSDKLELLEVSLAEK